MEHPPYPEERRRRVSPGWAATSRASWFAMSCSAAERPQAANCCQPPYGRSRCAGRRRGAANKAARSVVVPVTDDRLGSRRPVAAPFASKNRTGRPGERQRCWFHSRPSPRVLLVAVSPLGRSPAMLRAASLFRSHTRPALEQALERAWKRRARRRTACSCWDRSRCSERSPAAAAALAQARALLAYLAMAPRPVTREKLCELFWDVADDPKSELRWCLSKLRPLVNGPTATRLIADRERVRIDTGSLDIDAISLARNGADDADERVAAGSSVAESAVPWRLSRRSLRRPGATVRQLAVRPTAPLWAMAAAAARAAQRRLAAGER